MSVPWWGGDVIETLDHQERSAAARPPFVLLYASAGRQVSDMDLRPALDRREDLWIGGRRQPSRAERDAFRPHQLGRWCVSEHGTQRCRRANPAARRDKDDAAHHRRMIGRQAAGDPVTEGVTQDVSRAALERRQNSGNIRGKIVKGRVVQRPSAGTHTSHIDGDDLRSGDAVSKAFQIARAASGVGEDDKRIARSANGAFEARRADIYDLGLSQPEPPDLGELGSGARPVMPLQPQSRRAENARKPRRSHDHCVGSRSHGRPRRPIHRQPGRVQYRLA